MNESFFKENRYESIINVICNYKGISREELKGILKKKEYKYLLFLLLKKYNCSDLEKVKEDLHIKTNATIRYNLKRAEEKLYINKEFREVYFQLDEMTKKII